MKRVLIVAYQYPPEGGASGVLRTLKFSKYLPQYGWIPHVLTLRESFYTVRDEKLMDDIPPEAVVHRTFALDTGRHLAIKGKYLGFLAVPDRFISWLPFGAARGIRVVRNFGIDVIFSSSPPPTAHLIAAATAKATGIPWVADFRDPWIEEGIHPSPGSVRYRVESSLERWVVMFANRLVVTTPHLREDFLSRYPGLRTQKVHVIYNGYDEDDFRSLRIPDRPEVFEIIHAGLVTPEFRDPSPVLKAVGLLIQKGQIKRDHLRLTFLGGGGYTGSTTFMGKVKALGLEDVVRVKDRVPHEEALMLLGRSAVLLLLQASDDTRALIPAKAFEYLRIGRPILAIIHEGATADLLRKMDLCYAARPSDDNTLSSSIVEIYKRWQSAEDGLRVMRPIARYERNFLSQELAHELNSVIEEQD